MESKTVGVALLVPFPATRLALSQMLAPQINVLCNYYGLPVAGVGKVARKNALRVALGIPPQILPEFESLPQTCFFDKSFMLILLFQARLTGSSFGSTLPHFQTPQLLTTMLGAMV
jgi:hypothetical protein